jgi:diaminohydroxyphosphoribosylaminopyrimidine deaminase / 5-amino-6-(5-phosphoribosylamino)uracil reductase
MRLGANLHSPGSDEYYIYEALQLAHNGLGWTAPNPLVGAVIVRDGQVLGRGAHLCDGQEHAEVLALREAGDARGATCYASLEPCTHVGRQPSCSHTLARAGVARVVYGAQDGDARTAGQADPVLAELGVSCTGGVLREQCLEFLDYYLYGHCLQRAFMHLKLALSLDAKVACASGHSQWLSGPVSLGYAHYLRQKYDAVLVGYHTVLADDPRLTVRQDVLAAYRELGGATLPRNPVRVVLDPRFELLPRLQEFRLSNTDGHWRPGLPQIVLAGLQRHTPISRFDSGSVTIVTPEEAAPGVISFEDLAQRLWQLGIRSVLVEGGAGLARAILLQQCVDKMTLVYTPTLIGADGLGFSPELHRATVGACPHLSRVRPSVLGEDCVMEGYPDWNPESSNNQ